MMDKTMSKELLLRRYWSGKRPSIRNAVEDYLKTIGLISQEDIALKHGCHVVTIRTHVVALREKDLLKYYVSEEMVHYIKTTRRCPSPIARTISVRCRKCDTKWYPNSATWRDKGDSNGKSVYCPQCNAKNMLSRAIADSIISEYGRDRQ